MPNHLVVASGIGLLLGMASLWLSPVWILGGLFGIIFLAVITYRPELGLLTIVLITSGLVDFERLPLLSMGPISFHIPDVILFYLLVIVLTRALVQPNYKIIRTPLDAPLICFYFAILLSATIAIFQFSVDVNFVLRRLRPLTYYLGFFAVTNLIKDKQQLLRLINGLFVIAILAALAVLIQAIYPSIQLVRASTVEVITAGREYPGVVRTFMQAERLIYVMLLVSVCSLILRGKWLPTIMEFIRVCILGIGLFMIFQRNYWVSMISMLALLGMIVSWTERSRILRWAIVGAITFALLISLPGVSAINRYVTAAVERLVWGMHPETLAQDGSTQMRVLETEYAIQSIAQHPLLGIGLENVYRPTFEGDAYWNPEDPSIGLRWYIHNAYLWVWVMMGLIGFIPFIWLFASVLKRGFTRWRKIGDLKLRAVVLGFTLAILGQAISNIVAPNFIQSWVLIVFAIIFGINELIFSWEVPEMAG